MTIQFVGGLLIGMALTFMGVVSAAEYIVGKDKERDQTIIELTNERDAYRKMYMEHRSRVDSD